MPEPVPGTATESTPIAHRCDGQGQALLMLNGIAMTIPSWEPMAARLRHHYRVVRCDLRGQLLSPGTPPANAGSHADDVVRLLDHLSIDKVHIVSTSFGAVIGALVAGGWPDRVLSLASIASTDAFDGPMAAGVRRWRQACLDALEQDDFTILSDALQQDVYSRAFVAANREQLEQRRRQIASLPRRWLVDLVALLDSAGTVTLRSRLGRIRCPALVVAAEHDSFIPRERTEALAAAIPGARFHLFPGAGHAVAVEQPEQLAELCLQFLESVNTP